MSHKFINKLIRKQEAGRFILALFVTVILCLAFYSTPVKYKLKTTLITTMKQLNSLQISNNSNVQMTLDNIEYAGFDYVVNNQKKGSYYYTFLDDTCLFMLLKYHSSPPASMTNYTLYGKVLVNDFSFEHFLNRFSKEIDWTYSELEEMTVPILVSEVHYPFAWIVLFLLLFLLIIIFTCYTLISSACRILNPALHPIFKSLISYDSRNDLLDYMNKECEESIVFAADYIIITDMFLIYYVPNNYFFIRLSALQSFSKGIESDKTLFGRKKIKYSLKLTFSDNTTKNLSFYSEALVDELLHFLDKLKTK